MIRLLALETATEICSVALLEDNRIVDYHEEFIPRLHAQKLPLFVRDILTSAEWQMSDLDGIALSIGPGSFTGLRVGLSFAKGLAYSHGLPLIPISTLEGFAQTVSPQTSGLTTLLYSHGDQVYAQDWKAKEQIWSAATSPYITSLDDWRNRRTLEKPVVYWFGEKQIDPPSQARKVQPTARNIGLLAIRDFQERNISEAFDLTPEYIASFKLN